MAAPWHEVIVNLLSQNFRFPINGYQVSLTQVPLRQLLHREVVEADADQEDGREEDRRGFEGEFCIIHLHCAMCSACIFELMGF